MKKKTLSIVPYYGGKAKMAHFIAERLDYDRTSVFVTPFGGGARCLLNKPRHAVECYNDLGTGITTLMWVLSQPNEAKELIHQLYETEYSREEFNRAKEIYDFINKDLEAVLRNDIKVFLNKNMTASSRAISDLMEKLLMQAIEPHGEQIENFALGLQEAIKEFLSLRSTNKQFDNKIGLLVNNWLNLYLQKEEEKSLPSANEQTTLPYSDIEIAKATYIVFTQSRDGMGTYFSEKKSDHTEQYRKRILNLYECAQRMEGVLVYQIDAMQFFKEYQFDQEDLSDEFKIMNEWLNNEDVMMCCDPSYIDPDEEADALEGLETPEGQTYSDAIEAAGRRLPGDLGKVYTASFNYRAHETFLQCIKDSKCKIMVCNYDLKLYDKYLAGWKRCEYHTTTSVGGKKGNYRKEVIWYNY